MLASHKRFIWVFGVWLMRILASIGKPEEILSNAVIIGILIFWFLPLVFFKDDKKKK